MAPRQSAGKTAEKQPEKHPKYAKQLFFVHRLANGYFANVYSENPSKVPKEGVETSQNLSEEDDHLPRFGGSPEILIEMQCFLSVRTAKSAEVCL